MTPGIHRYDKKQNWDMRTLTSLRRRTHLDVTADLGGTWSRFCMCDLFFLFKQLDFVKRGPGFNRPFEEIRLQEAARDPR